MAGIGATKIRQVILLCLLCAVASSTRAWGYSYLPEKKAAPQYRVSPLWSLQMQRDRFFKFQKSELATPVLEGSQLLVPSDSGFLYAVTKETGKVQWIFKAAGRLHAAPLLDGPLLYIGDSKGLLYAVDRTSGKEVWRTHVGGEIVTTPSVADDKIFVGDAASRLVALKKSDGSFVWQGSVSRPQGGIIYYSGTPLALSGGNDASEDLASPVLARGLSGGRRASAPESFPLTIIGGTVDGHYFRSPLGGGTADWVKPSDGKRGVVAEGIWDVKSIGDDVVIGTSHGSMCRVEAGAGKQKWCATVGDGVQLAVNGEKIYAGNFSGEMRVIDLITGAELWTVHGLEGPLTAPAPGENFVAVGAPKVGLLLVNPESLSLGYRRYCKGGVAATPVAEGDRVYFVTGMGRITALKVSKIIKKTNPVLDGIRTRKSRLKSL